MADQALVYLFGVLGGMAIGALLSVAGLPFLGSDSASCMPPVIGVPSSVLAVNLTESLIYLELLLAIAVVALVGIGRHWSACGSLRAPLALAAPSASARIDITSAISSAIVSATVCIVASLAYHLHSAYANGPVSVERSTYVTTGEPYYESQGSTDFPPYGQDDTNQGSSATQQVTENAKQGAKQVKQTASEVTDQAKQKTLSQAAAQKDQAAQSLNTVSDAVNQAAQQLRQNNQAPIAQVAETAAAGIGQLADHLRTRNINDLIGEVEDFASNQPALFLGGAFLVGVIGARFLKSSRAGLSQPTSRQWRGGPSSYPSLPGRGANVNTGGLAYGRNLPTNGSPEAQATVRRGNGTYETHPTDEDIIAGKTPR